MQMMMKIHPERVVISVEYQMRDGSLLWFCVGVYMFRWSLAFQSDSPWYRFRWSPIRMERVCLVSD